jgi:DNA-directed RNA polymerase subunit M/transcription elongation factor TFIIS
MNGKVGRISMSNDNKVKLEYEDDGKNRIVLWELFKGGLLETVHDQQGAILKQSIFKNEKNNILNDRIGSVIKKALITKTTESEYIEVKLDKKCPSCGNQPLKMVSDFSQGKSNVPVMPIYKCTECNGKGYYLTDEYLEQLITEQAALFTSKEKEEMEANRVAFKAQLNEYIIRIFASKRIIQIK